jgi:hypothetical protein
VSIQFDFPIFILKGKVLLIEEEGTESGKTIKYQKMELELYELLISTTNTRSRPRSLG